MLITITTSMKNQIKTIDHKLLIGIGWKLLSCACFAGINIIVRYLSGSKIQIEQKLPSLVIMFFQNTIGGILLLPFVLKKHYSIHKLIPSKNLSLQIIRVFIAMLGVFLWYISLAKMPITEAVAISFISPILVLVGAILILKEQLNIKKFIAILLSFTGGFLISRPDLAMANKFHGWTAIYPIGAALIFAIDKLITRKILILQECPKLTTIYVLLFTAPICWILALLNNSWVTPIPINFIALLLLGILSALANLAFNKSLAIAEISTIMPYGISKIIFSSILSYIIFQEIPQNLSLWLGIIVITLSTILII